MMTWSSLIYMLKLKQGAEIIEEKKIVLKHNYK